MGKKPAQKSVETAKKTTAAKTKAKKPVDKVVKAKSSSTSSESCQIKGCKQEHRAKGYCRMHYKKWRRGEYGLARYKTCTANDCRKPMVLNKKGYCEEHYMSYYVRGEAKPVQVQAEKAEKAEKTAAA